MHKNIVIAPCSNKSYLFKDAWLKQKTERDFDLCLLFYHKEINNPEYFKDADFFFHFKNGGFKYGMTYDILHNQKPEWLDEYEYFFLLDDDLEMDTRQLNKMFMLSKAFDTAISQPSLSKDSFYSWPIFRNKKNSFCRFIGQIEVMGPLFSRDALKKCLASFIANKSGWGVDSVWSKILGYPEDKLVVFDAVIMRHTMPIGGGELYKNIGINPRDEWSAITNAYGAKKQNYIEYGRLAIVNKKQNKIHHYLHKLNEFIVKRKRDWHDYDINSRIKSQKKKLLGKK